VQNSYFDDAEYNETPIKTYFKPYYLTSRHTTSLYYYMLISENQVKLYDNWIGLGAPNRMSYIETRVDYSVTQELESSDGPINSYMAIYIQMDD
jgi:hypothetical protein